MKRLICSILVLGLMTSCVTNNHSKLFNPKQIKEITSSVYVPIYLSYHPAAIRNIKEPSEIKQVIDILNRALLNQVPPLEIVLDDELSGFDYELTIANDELIITQIYIMLDGSKAYITSLSFKKDGEPYPLYEIQNEDREAFQSLVGY